MIPRTPLEEDTGPTPVKEVWGRLAWWVFLGSKKKKSAFCLAVSGEMCTFAAVFRKQHQYDKSQPD